MSRPKKLPEILSKADQVGLISYLNSRLWCRTGLQNALLIRLMLNSGFRASEVLNLRYRDIDWYSGDAWVRDGKGKKDRAIKIAPPDLNVLREWVEKWRGGNVGSTAWVFCSKNFNRLDDRWLRRMVKQESAQAGLEKDVHPHTLRHSWASDFYANTRDLAQLQILLGHTDVRTTMVYVHINPAEAMQISADLAMARLSLCNTM